VRDAELDRRLRAHLKAIAETAAPPFAEGRRGAVVADRWRAAGLNPSIDDLGNVVAEVPGGVGPRVLLAAHLDSVFPEGTDVRVREEAEDRWCGPGIGDDASGLAMLTVLAEEVAADRPARRPRLVLAATVGEEGLGDLRGARRVVADRAGTIDVFVAVDGHLGQVVDAAVGSRRIEARFRAQGGHAWGDHGAPSAVHALGDAIHALARVPVPKDPRSSLNVGLASGGSSVNAIAEEARLTVDVRSVARGPRDRGAAALARGGASARGRARAARRGGSTGGADGGRRARRGRARRPGAGRSGGRDRREQHRRQRRRGGRRAGDRLRRRPRGRRPPPG
jgi:acetylornithine deacetylase/succinyl-diaminopimelate desuccinylase-like protein